MSATDKRFVFANMHIDGTWESGVLERVESMAHIEEALALWLQTTSAPSSARMGRCIAVPRYDPIVDNLSSHPAFFNRTANNQTLANVAYRAVTESSSGQQVEATYYAQVITMGSVPTQGGDMKEFVYCRGYQCVSSPDHNPLGLQPLVWEPTPRPAGNKRPKTNTVPGHFFVLEPQALQRRVCIIPDNKLGDGHFFVNHLVHEAEAHLAAVRVQQ
jgi:hypothetical protein